MSSRTEKRTVETPAHARELRQFPLLQELDDEVLERMLAAIEIRRLRPRRSLHVGTELAGRVALVWSGRFHQLSTAQRGAPLCLATFEVGGAVGLSTALLKGTMGASVNLMSEGSGTLLLVPGALLLELNQSSHAFSRAATIVLAQQATLYGLRMYEFAAFDVRSRLQSELLRLAQESTWRDGSCVIRSSPTQADLASRISATREAVSRHLADLEQDGLIKRTRRVIEIKNIAHWLTRASSAQSAEYFALLAGLSPGRPADSKRAE